MEGTIAIDCTFVRKRIPLSFTYAIINQRFFLQRVIMDFIHRISIHSYQSRFVNVPYQSDFNFMNGHH